MKFIRHIVIGLALLAAFVVLSIFSTQEYTEEKTNLDSNEDKLPGVNVVLSSFSQFLSLAEKIPVPDFLAIEKKETTNDKEISQENVLKNQSNIKEENFKELASITPEMVKNTNWSELFNKVKEVLSRDWFRP